jgi:superfamily II DNA or RNA helicase
MNSIVQDFGEYTHDSNMYLRGWQKQALSGYNERQGTQKIEVTAAYQGSGKTIYSAACFLTSAIGLDNVRDCNFNEIKNNHETNRLLHNKFVLIFYPLTAIESSTIKAWGSLGVNLVHLDNTALLKSSPSKLKEQGFDGILVTYKQAIFYGWNSEEQEWIDAPLVKFLKSCPELSYHAVLDECHAMTIKVGLDNTFQESNVTAQFMMDNHTLFDHVHLLTGTPIKANKDSLISYNRANKPHFKRIPFLQYDNEGRVLPDTIYSQEDAIREGTIVKTVVTILSLNTLNICINGNNIIIRDCDLDWFLKNYHKIIDNKDHPDYDRLREIEEGFRILYSSIDLWKQLIIAGEDKLNKVREQYPNAIGLIFAPDVATTRMIYKCLLPENSIICFAKNTENKFTGCNGANSKKIHNALKDQKGRIRWIINCLTLKEGFDYPDCKVSIMIPPLTFLSLCRISQMIGRTNRSIQGFPFLKSHCVSIRHPSLEKLIEIEKDSRFGICEPDDYQDSWMVANNLRFIQEQEDETDEDENEDETDEDENEDEKEVDEAKINDFMLSSQSVLIDDTGKRLISLDSNLFQKLNEISIRSYWHHWEDIIDYFSPSESRKNDFDPSNLPRNIPGVYIIVNATTTEILYVGESKRLLDRISPRTRYNRTWWRKVEGRDLYIRWIYTDQDPKVQQELTKKELRPKYDGEKCAGYVAC